MTNCLETDFLGNFGNLQPLIGIRHAVEAVDESVINAIVAGEEVAMFRPTGQVCTDIDTERLMSIMATYGRTTANAR